MGYKTNFSLHSISGQVFTMNEDILAHDPNFIRIGSICADEKTGDQIVFVTWN
jgi:hypothetical protein